MLLKDAYVNHFRDVYSDRDMLRDIYAGEVLLSLTSVKGVIVSINPHWWEWPGVVPLTRVRGRIIKWVSKRAGIEQLSIEWARQWGRWIYCWTGDIRRARSIGLVETLRCYGQVSHGRTVCFHLGTMCQWYTSSNYCDKGFQKSSRA
jgi:hypothetical protein